MHNKNTVFGLVLYKHSTLRQNEVWYKRPVFTWYSTNAQCV